MTPPPTTRRRAPAAACGRLLAVAGLVAVLGLAAALPASADGEGVVGGGSFNDAEALEAGTFQDRIELDQTLYYRVPRAAGQTASLAVEVRGDTRDPLPAATLELALFDDARVPAGDPAQVASPLDGKRAEVRAGDAEVLAGGLLAAVGLISDGLELAEGGPYDLTLTITLDPPVAPPQATAPAPAVRRPAPQPAGARPRPAAQLLPAPTPPQQPILIAAVAFIVGFGLAALHLARSQPPPPDPSSRPRVPKLRVRS